MVGAMHFNIDAFTHYYGDGELMTPYSRPGASQAHVLTCKDGKRVALHYVLTAQVLGEPGARHWPYGAAGRSALQAARRAHT